MVTAVTVTIEFARKAAEPSATSSGGAAFDFVEFCHLTLSI